MVSTDPDDVTRGQRAVQAGRPEWRVRGGAQYCSANNLVSVYWNKPGSTPVLLGTTTPTAALGVCGYDFRLKNTPTALRATAAGTITVKTALGGDLTRAFNLL